MKNFKTFDLIYFDKDIVVCSKKANFLSTKNLNNELNCQEELENFLKSKIFIVHRLDKATSGLIIFARNMKIRELLINEFSEHKLLRLYEAEVYSQIDNSLFDYNLEKTNLLNLIYENKMQELICDKTKCAKLEFNLYEDKFNNIFVTPKKTNKTQRCITYILNSNYNKQKNTTNLILLLETGKRNQIRASLSYIGNTIINDNKYLKEKNSLQTKRNTQRYSKDKTLHLNAFFLSFPNLKSVLKEYKFEIKRKYFI